MLQTVIPQGYAPCLNLYDTQKAIGLLKRLFEDTLGGALHLRRVSAPLFVEASTGLNDDLNGVERAVSFDIPDAGRDAQVVHSLAKWKRMALYRYQFSVGEGLYTDMNAIRRDEELDNLHSVYVDQWDWEKIIAPRDRNADYLRQTVRTIVSAMAETQHTLRSVFPQLTALPPLGTEVSFVTTQELEELWPDRSPKEREDAWVKEHPVTFLMGIGGALKSGRPHDGRAPDYDDWTLNGDILVWNPVLKRAFELSSMGIRGDAAALAQCIRDKLGWFADEGGLSPLALALRGEGNPSYARVDELARGIAGGLEPLRAQGIAPVVLVEADQAKVLGQAMAQRVEGPLLCLDSVGVDNGDYIDIGAPVAGGAVLPVVIKTLVFNKS